MSLTKLGGVTSVLAIIVPAQAQAPDPSWTICRANPSRACVLSEAVRSAKSLTQPTARAEGLDSIVRALADGQRFDEALALSTSLLQQGDSLQVRRALTAALAKAGRFAQADSAARAILNPGWRAVAELAIAEALAMKGDIAAAKAKAALARQLAHSAGREGDFALPRVATALIQWGDIDEAVALARAIASPQWRLRGLIDVAKDLAKTRPSLALDLLREAAAVASDPANPVGTIYDMRDVALAQAAAGGTAEARTTFAQASEVTRRFSDRGTRDTFLEVIGIGLANAGLMAQALELVHSMGGDWPRVRIAVATGEAEAKAGRRAEAGAAYDLAARVADEGRPAARPFLQAHIAESEARAGLAERVPVSLDRMDKAVSELEAARRADSLAAAAMTRVRLAGNDAAATLAAIPDQGARDAALRTLVEEHLKAGRLDAAKAAALAMSKPLDRDFSLGRIAAAQAKTGRVDDALVTLDAMSPIHYLRVDALAAIAVALAK